MSSFDIKPSGSKTHKIHTDISVEDILDEQKNFEPNLDLGHVEPPDTDISKTHPFAKITYLMHPEKNGLILYVFVGQFSEKHASDVAAYYKLNPLDRSITEHELYKQKEKSIVLPANSRVRVSRFQHYFPLITEDIIGKLIAINKVIHNKFQGEYKAELYINQKNRLILKTIHFIKPEIIHENIIKDKNKLKNSHSYRGIVFGQLFIPQLYSTVSMMPKNAIVLFNRRLPVLFEMARKAKGIIITTPDIAINEFNAKEIYKPAVTLLNSEMDFRNKEYITLNSNDGTVKKLNFSMKQTDKINLSVSEKINKMKYISPEATDIEKHKLLSHAVLIPGNKITDGSNRLLSAESLQNAYSLDSKTTVYFKSFFKDKEGLIGEFKEIKKLLYDLHVGKLVFILPDAVSSLQIEEVLTSSRSLGLTRSVRFNIFFSIVSMQDIIHLEKAIDEGVDGIIMDWEKTTKHTYGFDESLNPEKFRELSESNLVFQILETCLAVTKRRNIPLYISAFKTTAENMEEKFLKLGVKGFVIKEITDSDKKSSIVKNTVSHFSSL